ncbi:MAG: NAD-dependent epimerase/dehydratase [Neomegalonema sp.]|nr:NAD-dependent epimerase/dehydratase [Neomegalonema sp.]
MLIHGGEQPQPPERVVIIGASGFIGGAIAKLCLSVGLETLPLGRAEVDLLADDAAAALATLLRAGDTVVAAAAIAPVKSPQMLIDNIRLAEAICGALRARSVAHLINISSDAIYADSAHPMDETARREPTSLHGAMHATRELMLTDAAGATPVAHLRPTLVYGADDPHGGYGPNRFRREAAAGGPIRMFGKGEERRDHVDVLDVAELAVRIALHRSRGALNAATGDVHSFASIAAQISAQFDAPIEELPRSGPMPHNGYRAFDPAATRAAFPDFTYRPLPEGLERVRRALEG